MEDEVIRAMGLAVKRCHGAADPGEKVGEEEEKQMEDAILMREVAREVCNEPQVTDELGSKEKKSYKECGQQHGDGGHRGKRSEG